MSPIGGPYRSPLPQQPQLPHAERARLETDYTRFQDGLPLDPRGYCLEAYGVDIAGEYAGAVTANPFGKASGQLSLNVRQVRRDVEAGLGFIVLKTVIAEDAGGGQTMGAWAIPETRMRVDRIRGQDGEPGWTVTWKGRGWHADLESYCRFFGEAVDLALGSGVCVAPSVKYHLPGPDEGAFSLGEYEHTTRRLQDVWHARASTPMPLEKDFSPTLAGDDRSRQEAQVLTWLREAPALIAGAAREPGIRLGVKLMNARGDDALQVEMIRALLDEGPRPPGYLVYANRLFDPAREFEGETGVAYGGPDLSARNLRCLAQIREASRAGGIRRPLPPLSASGDILCGRRAVEYGLLGAASCQMHTVFQLPESEFSARTRNRSAAVLHHLLFHPETGLLAWLLHLGELRGRRVHWIQLPEIGPELPPPAP